MTTVLIIDDEPDMCTIVKLNLQKAGKFRVLTATNGKAGIALAKKNSPDIILLDIMMPGMKGSEVAENLAEDYITRDIPIIFLTAAVKENEVQESGGYIDGHPFLAKPVSLDGLIDCIERTLG